MKKEEYTSMLKTLFPVGKERWIKVKYNDFDWCVKNLRLEPNEKLGFEVVSIGCKADFIPQISALQDIKEDITGILYDNVDDHVLSNIRNIINEKMKNLKEQSTVDL